MFKNLFKIAVRNILKDKTYSAINIIGLTIGITCSLFLLMYILDELSFDRYHKNADNIYRVVSNIKEPDNAFTWSVAQIPLAEELRDHYPEVKNAVRFFQTGRTLYKNGDKQFNEENFVYVDSSVFLMFTYNFIEGDQNTALNQPNSMVLSQKMAIKYFGNESAIGKSLQNQQGDVFKITGVIEDVPMNSHFRFDALISRSTQAQQQGPGAWGNFGVYTYVQLPAGYDLTKIYTSLDKILKEKVNPIFEPVGIKIKYELQRITDIHLHSKIQDEAEAGGDISYIYIFGLVAIFMIVIACINYMNLATARSANRAKEVGVRKVMGSQRRQLVGQFITESSVIAFASLVFSLILIYALLPLFNELSNKQLPFGYILQPAVLLSLVGVTLFVGIGGGSYPAFYLSGFSPVTVLKGRLAVKGGSVWLRRVLVVVQFSISIFMLISTLIVFDQLRFLRSADLGFDKQQIIRLELSGRELQGKTRVMAESMKKTPGVLRVGMADSSPGFGIGKLLFQVEDNDGKMVDRGVDIFTADYDFIDALGMKITEGRNFSRDIQADTSTAVLVNEAMVRRMAWTNPLQKKFINHGDNGQDEVRRVVGVIKDYHQNSLYDPIEPLMVVLGERVNFLFLKTGGTETKETLAAIEKTWKSVSPNSPFEYNFLDQDFDSQYKADEKRSQIFTVFSTLTICIACLGLLGLAAFATEQRTKEIGVRKVIGASIRSLVLLVSKEFFVLVSVGLIIAIPVALYVTDSWLQKFAFRIELAGEWTTFLASALLAFAITFLTVGYHVIRAASANPVKSLRDE